jgi:DNA-binding HxlR family transcriptional regulator
MATNIKYSSTNYQNLQILGEACDVNDTLRSIGARWKMQVLYSIRQGLPQFSKIKEAFPSVSDQVLGKRLRELESDGLVIKRVLKASVPFQSVYTVTEKGAALLKIMEDLHQWEVVWNG